MEPAIEMARLDDAGGGEIMELKQEIKEIKEMMKKGNSKILKTFIPMFGILILCGGLIVGVLSGYLIRLPHSQTDESGLDNVSKPGKLNGKG